MLHAAHTAQEQLIKGTMKFLFGEVLGQKDLKQKTLDRLTCQDETFGILFFDAIRAHGLTAQKHVFDDFGWTNLQALVLPQRPKVESISLVRVLCQVE